MVRKVENPWGLTHLGHKLSILVILREYAETTWRHFWEIEMKARNVFQRINYEALLDHESNILEFCKHMMLYELRKFEVITHIYVRKVKQLDDEISSKIKTMGHCDPTGLSLYFKHLTQTELNMIGQTMRSSCIDLEHGNQSDWDTCCQAFVDVFTTVQNDKTEMLNETFACPIMETEPVNQGTDVLEVDSQVISNPSPETSAMFLDCPEKKSGHVLKLKPKFNRKTAKLSHAQEARISQNQKEG